MQFNPKFMRVILGTLAASCAVFLAVCVSSLPAEPFVNTIHAYALNSAPRAGDACEPMFAALEKNITTPYHMYVTQTSAAVQNGKPRSGETIYVGGVLYVQSGAKWISRPKGVEFQKSNLEDSRQNFKSGSCRYLRDEAVTGESAAIISAHSQNEFGTNETQFWISKSRGLILKQETDVDMGGAEPKSHTSARYEYTNVQAPKM
jgi:hypothetical protein